MDLNKTPQNYRDELLEENRQKTNDITSKYEWNATVTWLIISALAIAVGIFIFCIQGSLLLDLLVGMTVATVVGVSATITHDSAKEKISYKQKEFQSEMERKVQEYIVQYENEVYSQSLEMHDNPIVKEICDFFMGDIQNRIQNANRNNTLSTVKVDFDLIVSTIEVELRTPTALSRKFNFNQNRIKDLPDYTKKERLARAISDQLKQRIQNTYREDVVCRTPITIAIQRPSNWCANNCHGYFVQYQITYSAPNSNYVQARNWN